MHPNAENTTNSFSKVQLLLFFRQIANTSSPVGGYLFSFHVTKVHSAHGQTDPSSAKHTWLLARFRNVVVAKSGTPSITSLRVIPTVTSYYYIFVTNSDIFCAKIWRRREERISLMKSRALRSLDFIRIILSSSSLLLVRGPAVTIVIYLAKLIQTDSRYAWFQTISDARASPDA